MSTGARSQCDACRNLKPGKPFTRPACTAFPDGIPDEVFDNLLDHRLEIPNDNGIRFAVKADDEFPAYAFA